MGTVMIQLDNFLHNKSMSLSPFKVKRWTTCAALVHNRTSVADGDESKAQLLVGEVPKSIIIFVDLNRLAKTSKNHRKGQILLRQNCIYFRGRP